MDRVIDPTIADLRREYCEADASGSAGRRVKSLLVGYASFWRVVALVLPRCAWFGLRRWASADDAAMGRTIRAILLTLFPMVALLVIPPLWMNRSHAEAFGWLALAVIPQALAIALPMAVLLGVLIGLRRLSDLPPSRLGRLRRAVAIVGFTASLVVFSATAWVVPRANQAFRVAVAGTDVRKGFSEMSFGEVRRAVRDMRAHGQPRLAGRFELVYQARLGIAGAAWCFALFAFALGAAFKEAKPILVPAAILGAMWYWACLFLVMSVRGPILEVPWMPVVLAWVPTLVLLAASLALLAWRPQRITAARI